MQQTIQFTRIGEPDGEKTRFAVMNFGENGGDPVESEMDMLELFALIREMGD